MILAKIITLSLRERAMGGGWERENERKVGKFLSRGGIRRGEYVGFVFPLSLAGFDFESCEDVFSDEPFDCWDDVIDGVFDVLSWNFVDLFLSDGWSSCFAYVDFVAEDCGDFEGDGNFWEEGLFEF